MRAMTDHQQASLERIRNGGQLRFVLIAAVLWFAVFGMLPLSFFLAHAVAPALLGVVFVAGLLVADVAWHFLECGRLERTGGASAVFLARRRHTLAWFLAIPCVAPLPAILIGVASPGAGGVVIGFVVACAMFLAALIALERSMKRTG